ncbi:MAG: hypothetical protein M0C28_06580 [Candidatus Moduliflexus flocculans]|nr:hypothetical protein [Candidatus Moduliflexus flocculans]
MVTVPGLVQFRPRAASLSYALVTDPDGADHRLSLRPGLGHADFDHGRRRQGRPSTAS